MNKRNIKYHIDQYNVQIQSGNEDTKKYFIDTALNSHSLVIHDVLRDMALEATKITLKSEQGSKYMLFGFGRRALMLFHSYRSIIFTIPSKRVEPLNFDETNKLNTDINSIYTNIRGALDNLVYAVLNEKEPDLLGKLNRSQIGMFSHDIKMKSTNNKLWEAITQYASWGKDLAEKRDPVAHRIPLYIIPQMLRAGSGQLQKYNEYIRSHNEKASEFQFDEASKMLESAGNVGNFVPLFAHEPESVFTVYPTIPSDINTLIEIYECVKQHLV